MDEIRQQAMRIVELFEDLLEEHGMMIPDDDRTGAEGEAPIYGVTYGNLVDDVEALIRKNDKKSRWVYQKGRVTCEKCQFQPEYSLYKNSEFSNSDFCPNCGSAIV